jgi:acetoin utilization protein AcuB
MDKIYNTTLICIKNSATLKQAKEAMHENRIRHLPVINSDNQIIGMLSKHDLIASEKLNDMPVELFASISVKTVDPKDKISKVALVLLENKISSVIVKDKNCQALGIITTDDLIYEFYRLTKKMEDNGQYDIIQGDVENDAGGFLKGRSL